MVSGQTPSPPVELLSALVYPLQGVARLDQLGSDDAIRVLLLGTAVLLKKLLIPLDLSLTLSLAMRLIGKELGLLSGRSVVGIVLGDGIISGFFGFFEKFFIFGKLVGFHPSFPFGRNSKTTAG